AVSVGSLPLIVPEGLLVEIAEQMERLDADIGSLNASLEQAPKILNTVGVHVPFNVALRVIDELMNVFTIQSGIRCQFVSEQLNSAGKVFPQMVLQILLFAILNMRNMDSASFAIQQADYKLLPRSARTMNLLSFLISVHVACETADKSFVSFNRT